MSGTPGIRICLHVPGIFYILYADFPNVCKRKPIKRIGEEKMFELFENLTNWLWGLPLLITILATEIGRAHV